MAGDRSPTASSGLPPETPSSLETLAGGPSDGLSSSDLATLAGDGAPATPASARESGAELPVRLAAGCLIAGEYEVRSVLGSGGMGVVYLARHLGLQRDVAIKLRTAGGGEEGQQRMLREAQIMARFSHPNVVTVYDVGIHERAVFIAMELAGGGSLRRWLEARRRGWREIVAMFAEAGAGLVAAHALGMVHRDFKPDNVLLGRDGRPRVGDFGIARGGEAGGADTSGEQARGGLWAAQEGLEITRSTASAFFGTPAYMAPEQFLGSHVDHRADQFAFCVALWEALHGARPFSGSTPAAVYAAIEAGERTTPPARHVPRWLRAAIARGLAFRAEDRWPSLGALLETLVEVPKRRRRQAVLCAAAGGVGLVATLAFSMGSAATRASLSEGATEVWRMMELVADSSERARLEPEPAPSVPAPVIVVGEFRTDASTRCDRAMIAEGITFDTPSGEAIWAIDGCDLTVRNCTFRGRTGISAGGNARIRVYDSVFENTEDGISLGGRASGYGHGLTIRQPSGRGVYVGGEADFALERSLVEAEDALYVTGMARARASDVELAGWEYGLVVAGGSVLEDRRTVIRGPISVGTRVPLGDAIPLDPRAAPAQ